MTTKQKTCFRCGAEKPLSEFYPHPQMADGHLNKCKCCTKSDAYNRRHNPESRDKVLEYDRKRGSRQDYLDIKTYRAKNPAAYKARSAVRSAMMTNKIERPTRCSHCHKQCKPQAHHEDYTKPLDVVWLCPACHHALHAYYETVGREIKGLGQ